MTNLIEIIYSEIEPFLTKEVFATLWCICTIICGVAFRKIMIGGADNAINR